MYTLYLKEHKITGLKYLGYTKKEDVNSYTGSGVYWVKHIKKHGYFVDTTILGKYSNDEDLKFFGKHYSDLWNVKDSIEFANLKTEEGVSGNYSLETRNKMSISARKRGTPKTAWNSEDVSKLNIITWKDPIIRQKRIDGIKKSLTGVKRKPRSNEFKQHMKNILTGRSYGYGIKHTLLEVVCPHCSKVGAGPNMTRYHFTNCKVA